MSYTKLSEANKAKSEANAARLRAAIKESEYDYQVQVIPVTFAVAVLGKDGSEISMEDKIKAFQ